MKVKQVQTKKNEGTAAGFRAIRRERQSSSAAFNPIALLCQSTERDHPQAKLKVGRPGDIYEKEADRISEQVMSMSESVAQRQSVEEEEPVQAQPLAEQITPIVQRQAEEEEESLQEKSLLQRQTEEEEEEEPLQTKRSGESIPLVSSNMQDRIQSLKGGGQPLSESSRGFFEQRFGRDFRNVRVHTDSSAAQTAKAVQAKAFTVGNDIVFGAGQYAPGMPEGRRVLAHELVHTIQQTGAGIEYGERPTHLQRTIGDGHDLTSLRFKGDPVLEACYDDERLLRKGDRGSAVEKIQQALVNAGFSLPRHGVDRKFGPETKAAVKNFQRASGLTGRDVDGIVGPITMGLFDARFPVTPARKTRAPQYESIVSIIAGAVTRATGKGPYQVTNDHHAVRKATRGQKFRYARWLVVKDSFTAYVRFFD